MNIWMFNKKCEHKSDCQTDIIVLDEAPMLEKETLESINEFLQELMHIQKNFGGKLMICAGDFRQILPVVKHGGKAETPAL